MENVNFILNLFPPPASRIQFVRDCRKLKIKKSWPYLA